MTNITSNMSIIIIKYQKSAKKNIKIQPLLHVTKYIESYSIERIVGKSQISFSKILFIFVDSIQTHIKIGNIKSSLTQNHIMDVENSLSWTFPDVISHSHHLNGKKMKY